jgi:hypothetical protein
MSQIIAERWLTTDKGEVDGSSPPRPTSRSDLCGGGLAFTSFGSASQPMPDFHDLGVHSPKHRKSRVSDLQIDEAILSVTVTSWRKVAFVIIKVADTMGSDLPEGDTGYNLIAKHIESLVRGGRLLAQGNIKNWRRSEVRKPN